MIKVKVNNEYKDVVKIFCGGTLQKEIIKVWSREAQEYVYESSVEYTGSLPIAITANGDALIDYRIYGADGGTGVATENLFDPNAKDTANGYEDKKVLQPDGTSPKVTGDEYYFITEYIEIPNNVTNLKIVRNSPSSISGICFYDANKEYISGSGNKSDNSPVIISCPTGAVFFRTSILRSYIDNAMVVKGSTVPTNYIPYGYKLPMTVSNGDTAQTVPVYIGENQLDSVEGVSDYVDKSSGKIVRRIKEYTFTGDENISRYGRRVHRTSLAPAPLSTENIISTRCSHFYAIPNRTLGDFTNAAENTCIVSSNTAQFCVSYIDGNLKDYLKAQYDNRTPVKLWYILETPIEEAPPVPLPEIPTIDGTTIIDYDGDPKPSQMYVKYRR